MSYSYKSSKSSSMASRYSRTRTGQRRNNNRRNSGRRGEYIDPSRFIKAATFEDAEDYVPTHKFSDFDLNQVLQKNLTARGYSTPTPIQDQAIPHALEGKDVIGIASTGTGKTAAFALPALNKLMASRGSSVLVVAPTRELAQQTESEIRKLSGGTGLYTTLLIGGSSMGKQLSELRRKPRIAIGTPGRIKDHIKRGTLKLHNFDMAVLDEVDRMLDMGFVHDVREILSHMNKDRQSLFFSATIDSRVKNLIQSFTNDPVLISLKTSETCENVHQDVVRFQGNSDKMDKLHDVLNKEEVAKVIVFDETQRSVERLNRELIGRGFSANAIHGGKSQGQRKRALRMFKDNEVDILVATDVAARGLDVADITHVVNFSVPKAYDDYVHRIGRAGRAGQVGYALTFVAG